MVGTVTADVGDLRAVVALQDCSEAELEHVARLGTRRTVAAGEHLLHVGGETGGLTFVLDGAVRIRDDRGLDHDLGAGDVVGEISALGRSRPVADVVTSVPSVLFLVEPAQVPALLGIEPVARRLRAIASARARATAGTLVPAAVVPVILPPPRLRGVGAGLHDRSDVPARPVRVVALMVAALAIIAASGWVLVERNATTEVSLADVLADARAAASRTPAAPSGSAGTVQAPADGHAPTAGPADAATPGTVTRPEAATPEEAPVPAGDPAAAVPEPASPQPTGAVAPGDPDDPTGGDGIAFHPPAPGVYTYATTGGESISLAGASHDYPEQTYAIVRDEGGCGWSVEHRVLEEHIDYLDRCTTDSDVFIVADGRDVEFFGQRDGITYRCDPPVAVAWRDGVGTQTTATCDAEGRDARATYDMTYLGIEPIDVGGQAVDAVHVQVEFTMTGDAEGSSTLEVWTQAGTGLVLRLDRTVDTRAKAAWGDVRYQEQATFSLLSLDPQT